jgi:hypothetical protein
LRLLVVQKQQQEQLEQLPQFLQLGLENLVQRVRLVDTQQTAERLVLLEEEALQVPTEHQQVPPLAQVAQAVQVVQVVRSLF